MRIKLADDFFIVCLYILSGIMLVGQFFGVPTVTSLAYALSFIFVLALWCLCLKECRILDILAVFIIAISFISVLLTSITLSINYFTNWLTFSSVFLYFSLCMKVKVKKQTIKKLFAINFIVSVCCCIAYIVRFDKAFYITFSGVRYLMFNFYNPNCLAIFLFCLALTGILYGIFYTRKIYWIAQLCVIAFLALLIMQTLSRTAIFTFAFFVIIFVLFKRKKRYLLPKSNFFCFVIALFPFLISIAYMIFLEKLVDNKVFSFMISEGKDLESRKIVWEYAFELFLRSPIFGSYGQLLQSTTFTQVHNSHLNVLVSYGVVVFALTVLFLFLIMKKISQKSKQTHLELSVWAFVACIILGSGEAILFSGGLSFYLLAGQFLLLSHANSEKGGELSR